jgi:hypothetical protein
MAVNLSPYGGVGTQFFDNSGNVLTGGKIFTYAGGTTTPQVTYTTNAGNIPHPNPIILDASGRVPSGGEIWLSDGLVYKFILRDANDVLIATYDGITGINSNFVAFTNQQEIQTATAGQTVFNLANISYQPGTNSLSVFVDGVNQYGPGAQYAYLETDSDTVTFLNGLHVGAEVKFTTSQLNTSGSTNDAFQVSYTPPFTNSVSTNVGDKLAQTVSVKDFGAVGDGVTDDTVAIQAAIAALPVDGGDLIFPPGQYLFSTKITVSKKVRLIGSGGTAESLAATGATVLIKSASLLDDGIVLAAACASIENLEIRGQTGNTGDGILIAAGRVVLTDVAVYNMGQDGVRIGTNAGVNANLWQIKNLKSKSNGRHGLHISDKVFPTPPDANGGLLSGADLQANTSDGLHLGNAQLNTFNGVVCQSNGANGINVTAAGIGNTFVGGESEANTLDEILCDASSVGNTFLGIMVPGTVVNNDAQNIFVGGYGHQIGNGIFLGNRGSLNTKTLDWYEEGTVVPVITFATPGDLSVTYATQYGRFTRIGNLVNVSINVLTSAFTYSTANGELRITGLPYTTLNVGGAISASSVLYSGVTDHLRPVLSAFVPPNTNYVAFRLSGSGVATAIPSPTNLPSGSTVALAFTLNYQVPT